MIFKFFNL